MTMNYTPQTGEKNEPPVIKNSLEKFPEGQAKKKPTSPWQPASMLVVSPRFQRPGYVQRWCRKAEIEKKLAEGWEVVRNKDAKVVSPEKTLIDGTPLDTTVQKRELILMEMPVELANARKQYYDQLSDGLLPSAKRQYDKDVTIGEHGSRATGEIVIK